MPRQIYDYIIRSSLIDKLFENLQDRQLLRNICRSGHRPNYADMEENLAQVGNYNSNICRLYILLLNVLMNNVL